MKCWREDVGFSELLCAHLHTKGQGMRVKYYTVYIFCSFSITIFHLRIVVQYLNLKMDQCFCLRNKIRWVLLFSRSQLVFFVCFCLKG